MNQILRPLFLTAIAASTLASHGAQPGLPDSHLIAGFPWHIQMNGLFCGDGALESVYDYWGPDLDQKVIANVARSSSMGTWSDDIRRAGHFSHLSAAQGSYFPQEVPTAGYPERPLGYAAFSHAATAPWYDELKALIAADIPVILLMQFAPDGTGGGHYRTAVGYDDNAGVIYFCDPWGRDMRYLPGTEGLIAWTYSEVSAAWNYAEYGTPLPYFGVAIMPWQIQPSVKGKRTTGSTITVSAQIHYPCPEPFDSAAFPASHSLATLTVPAGMTLLGPATIPIGTFGAGDSRSVSWRVRIDGPITGQSLTVQASGRISGSVPAATWTGGNVAYPPYAYTDEIGSSATLGL